MKLSTPPLQMKVFGIMIVCTSSFKAHARPSSEARASLWLRLFWKNYSSQWQLCVRRAQPCVKSIYARSKYGTSRCFTVESHNASFFQEPHLQPPAIYQIFLQTYINFIWPQSPHPFPFSLCQMFAGFNCKATRRSIFWTCVYSHKDVRTARTIFIVMNSFSKKA